ncbi:hypothetical protein GCM10022380_06190 [Amycolatopsis tucumanensis]|uniref:Uncharacterized protein n=1 Tax=Amycolatopsis tucumanensis TaxID=401106 RepID=A0ABP7HEB5_9PSEU
MEFFGPHVPFPVSRGGSRRPRSFVAKTAGGSWRTGSAALSGGGGSRGTAGPTMVGLPAGIGVERALIRFRPGLQRFASGAGQHPVTGKEKRRWP